MDIILENEKEEKKQKKARDAEIKYGNNEARIAFNDETESVKYPDIILDFSSVYYIDTNGVNMLKQLISDYKKIGVTLYICQAQGICFN